MSYSQLVVPQSPNRITRLYRFWRAIWHDTRALLSEFRYPLLAMILSVLVGGILYGELHTYAGYTPEISMIDRPYTMIQLMIIETPPEYSRTPHEWYLIIFWYLQPLIGVYIIGRGAVDFGRLFFDRNERRSAWELAVAQTYRNHVVLVGVGHVGLRIARTLSQMGFEIVGVDDNIDIETDEELSRLGIPLVSEDARTTTALRHAGIEKARSVIVCTSNDHLNLEITMRARDLNPDVRIVTRMWDSRFAEQVKRFMAVQVLSASDLAAPAFAGSAVGIEITQTIQVGNHDYSMIKLIVNQGSFMEGKTIDFLQNDEDIDIVLHGLAGQEPIVHPAGSIVVKPNDTLVLFARHDKITDIVNRNHRISHPVGD
ncbi:MAG: NAD-binding protein [Chloroflexota bacterium]